MIEDSAIKAPKSPFAMRDNEIKVFDGKDGYASIDQVVFKIDMGYINELHFQILEIINDFESSQQNDFNKAEEHVMTI